MDDPAEAPSSGDSAVIRWALVSYVLSRLVVVGAGVLALVLAPAASRTPLTAPFTPWDGGWYISIAEHGYLAPADERPTPPPGADTSVDGAVAYFPLYPALVAGVGRVLPISMPVAALVVSAAFGAAAAVAFAKLAQEVLARDDALRAAVLFSFFPGAFVLSLAYPEGLLIFLASVCLLSLQRRAWLAAGIAAALASATRPNALALTLACGVASFLAIRRMREWRSLIAPILAPTGFLAFLGYLWVRTGSAWYWFDANHRYWRDDAGRWPELALLTGGSHPQVSGAGVDRTLLTAALLAGFAVLAALVALLLRASLPAPIVWYALGYEALALVSQALAPRPRFLFAAFPFILALAVAFRRRAYHVVLAGAAASMAVVELFYVLPPLQGRFPVAP